MSCSCSRSARDRNILIVLCDIETLTKIGQEISGLCIVFRKLDIQQRSQNPVRLLQYNEDKNRIGQT